MTKQQMFECFHEEMARNDVALFMKRTPEAPERGFSKGTARLLERVRVRYINTSAERIWTRTEVSR